MATLATLLATKKSFIAQGTISGKKYSKIILSDADGTANDPLKFLKGAGMNTPTEHLENRNGVLMLVTGPDESPISTPYTPTGEDLAEVITKTFPA